jgi:hypothetical protein
MTTKPALKKTNHDKSVQNAKMAFIVGLMDISWRLATVFLIPVLVGVVLDQVNDSSSYTVYGAAIGVFLSIVFIIKLGLEANK